RLLFCCFFFFNVSAISVIYSLSLHDALPICVFGRYSLDEAGLIFAGGEFDFNRYKTFIPDKDNILPIVDGAYFEDDAVTRVVERSEEHTSELQSRFDLVCRLLLEKKK